MAMSLAPACTTASTTRLRCRGSALVYGHTHIKVNEASEAHPGLWLFNPGSVSIPKDGTHSYGIYEGGAFRHVILEEE